MKKLLSIAFGLIGVLSLVGCSNDLTHDNSNNLDEEDKFYVPEGIDIFEEYVDKITTERKYTCYNNVNDIVYYSNGGLLKKVDDGYTVEIQEYDDIAFSNFVYEDNSWTKTRRFEGVIDQPIDLDILNFEDFYFVETEDAFYLDSNNLIDYGVDSIIVTYSDDYETLVFTIIKDGSTYKFLYVFENNDIELPSEYNDTQYGLDAAYAFQYESGFTSYKTKFKKGFISESTSEWVYIGVDTYDFLSVHTANNSYVVMEDVFTGPIRTYLEYKDGEVHYVDVNGEPVEQYKGARATIIYADSYPHQFTNTNMFIVDDAYNIYDLVKLSVYNEEEDAYYFTAPGYNYCKFFFDFENAFLMIEADCTRTPYTFYYDVYDFGNETDNPYFALSVNTTTYVNLTK